MTLTIDEMVAIVDADDHAVASIRGQVAIEDALSEVIAHALPSADEVELERIAYPLKVDLAIALGVLSPSSRALFMKLNAVRNRFSHKATAVLEAKDFPEIRNSLSNFHKKMLGQVLDSAKTPRDALRLGTIAALNEARGAARGLKVRKVEYEVLLEESKKLLKRVRDPKSKGLEEDFNARLKRRVNERLSEQGLTPSTDTE